MAAPQWARLQTEADVKLRRGAWYRILKLGAAEAVLEVNRRPLVVARGLLQIRPVRPNRWTVVPSPANAVRLPFGWGPRYAVCPSCRERAPLQGEPLTLRCGRCNGLFEVAWNEPYLLSA